MEDHDVGPVGIRMNLHLTHKQEPYKGTFKEPVLLQMDLSKYLHSNKDKYEQNYIGSTPKSTAHRRRRRNSTVINSI